MVQGVEDASDSAGALFQWAWARTRQLNERQDVCSPMKQSQKETTMKKYLVAAAFLGAFALTTTSASAAVVCNDDGDCWKVKEKLTYPSDVHVQIYDDDW